MTRASCPLLAAHHNFLAHPVAYRLLYRSVLACYDECHTAPEAGARRLCERLASNGARLLMEAVCATVGAAHAEG